MKKIILFLSISTFYQCQQKLIYTVKKDNDKVILNDLQQKLDLKDNFINIFFENNFNNEKVILSCDNKEIFNKNIITDHTINLADYHLQKEKCNHFIINIENQKKELTKKELEKYKYIYIKKNIDSINLRLSNAPKMYY